MTEFISEYNYFYNENQFIKYINKSIKSTYIDFLRTNSHYFYELNISIDKYDDFEYNYNTNYYEAFYNIISNYELSKEDIDFLKLFIEEKEILTEKNVGVKMGISQQAVNKRKRKIIDKINKNKLS